MLKIKWAWMVLTKEEEWVYPATFNAGEAKYWNWHSFWKDRGGLDNVYSNAKRGNVLHWQVIDE